MAGNVAVSVSASTPSVISDLNTNDLTTRGSGARGNGAPEGAADSSSAAGGWSVGGVICGGGSMQHDTHTRKEKDRVTCEEDE